MAIGYFTAALNNNRQAEVTQISTAMLARNPNDPVGLYYLAITRLLTHQEPALPLMAQALRNGMDRYIPIDPAIRAAVAQ